MVTKKRISFPLSATDRDAAPKKLKRHRGNTHSVIKIKSNINPNSQYTQNSSHNNLCKLETTKSLFLHKCFLHLD